MDPATLLADPEAIRLEKIVSDTSSLTLVVRATRTQAECPRCQRPSTRVHSYYTRSVADLPWHGVAVRLRLRTRRFRCKNSLCTKRIFCERLPLVVAHYGRKTERMEQALRLIDLLLGGEPGALAAAGLGMRTSPDTLLRRVRRAAPPLGAAPRVIGVADFAFRRGQRYGTLIVDLERRRVIDLLPDREGATLCSWLRQHTTVEVVSRDRARGYALGTLEGAPWAVQVADRFHLVKNLRDALEQLLTRVERRLRRQTMADRLRARQGDEAIIREGCRERLLPHLRRAGSQAPLRWPKRREKLPTPREASWLLLSDRLKPGERKVVDELCRLLPEIDNARELANGFKGLIAGRDAEG